MAPESGVGRRVLTREGAGAGHLYGRTMSAPPSFAALPTPDVQVPLRPGVGRVVLVVCALLYTASLLVTLLAFPDGLAVSADDFASREPLWQRLLPPVAGIAVVLLLPRRRPLLPAVPAQPRALIGSTVLLVALLALFLLAPFVVPLTSEDPVLLKAALFMTVPGTAVWLWSRRARSLRFDRPAAAWRRWAPAVAVAVFTVLSQLMPWVRPWSPGGMPVEMVIVAATATAITAGLGEELFFRRWLQTRLEAILGGAAGIALASVLFGLMHLATHGSGNVLQDVAQVIVVQGTFGAFVGVLWWRYRNFWMPVLAHLVTNGWAVVAWLVTGV